MKCVTSAGSHRQDYDEGGQLSVPSTSRTAELARVPSIEENSDADVYTFCDEAVASAV